MAFDNGITDSQHLDYLSSAVPPSGFAATRRGHGYTPCLSGDMSPHIAVNPNVWSIPSSAYVNIARDKPAILTMTKEEQDKVATKLLAKQEQERQAKTE